MTQAQAAFHALGAVLLAAGGSSRLGRPKQLVTIGNEVLVRRQARLLLSLEPACVVVVTGSAAPDVRAALGGLDVAFVHNADWEQGMGTSLACGIRAMPERVRGALLLLCDQWRIEARDLEALAAAWSGQPEAAVTAQWDGAAGPPTLFPRALFDRLSRLEGDRGAHQLLKRYRNGVVRLPMPNAAFDLDVPADIP